jgi:D-alanine transaminase
MENLGYYNGETGAIEDMKVPMNDRASCFGDGVYEAAIAVNHTIFVLDDHLNRFFNSAALIKIKLPFSKAELGDLLLSLVRKVDAPEQFVYWQVSRGTASRAHTFPEGVKPNLWVTIRPYVMPNQEKKLSLITVEDRRFFFCNIKTINLLPNVLASEEAKQAGCDEAVFHRGERVTECSHSNVHILSGGVFRTAPADNLILPGITRAQLIGYCRNLGIPVEEKPFTVAEMMAADEVIVTSTSRFCSAVERIDGKAVGGRAPELLGKLQAAMSDDFREKTNPQ